MREKRVYKEKRLAEAKHKADRANADLPEVKTLNISDESVGVSSTSTDDTDTTNSRSLIFRNGTHSTPVAMEFLSARRRDKKEHKIFLASKWFKAGIKPALNRTYPHRFMRPKCIPYRLLENQQRRCFADVLKFQTERNETTTQAAVCALDKLKGERGVLSKLLRTLRQLVLGLDRIINVFINEQGIKEALNPAVEIFYRMLTTGVMRL